MKYTREWCPRWNRYVRVRSHGRHTKSGHTGKVPSSCYRTHSTKPKVAEEKKKERKHW